MTRKTKLFVRKMADHAGLRIKYVSGLPAKVLGFLDPSKASRTIVVNANKSKSEHAFTILHEIAHYLLHYKRSHRPQLPWYLRRQWRSYRMNRVSTKLKRYSSKVFNKEREADLWSFCALLQIGATDDLQAMMKQHSDKNPMLYLCVTASIYTGVKFRIKKALGQIFYPFSMGFP